MALVDNIRAFWAFGDAYNSASLSDLTSRGNSLTPKLRITPCTAQFRMGRNSSDAWGLTYPQQLFGAIKGWGRWNRLLTAGEKTALAGKEYWPFNTTTTLRDALAYFLLDEAGGSMTYVDSTSRSNDLTATGTTVQVAGPAGTDYGTQLGSGIFLTKASPGSDRVFTREKMEGF